MTKLWSRMVVKNFGVGILLIYFGAVSGCSSENEVSSIGEGFGLQLHGSPLPHSPHYMSLLRTNSAGKWITVWQAISYRFEGTTEWNKSIVFGGTTDHLQSEKGWVRILYFSEGTGVIDLTDSLTRKG